jgi:hypothetical protein
MNLTNPRTRAITAFVLTLLILWFRASDRVSHGFLWAEDATEFLAHAHQFGKHSILLDYAGHLHVLPRLIAYAQFMLTPIHATPYFFMVVSLLTAAWSGPLKVRTQSPIYNSG